MHFKSGQVAEDVSEMRYSMVLEGDATGNQKRFYSQESAELRQKSGEKL
jgi:hypothetical protein